MTYTRKELCRVRTVTAFVVLEPDKEQWREEISRASDFLKEMSAGITGSGYEVQSLRIVTNPFGEYLDTADIGSARKDLSELQALLTDLSSGETRVRFSIGEARNVHEISLLPELIRDFGDLCNTCVNIGTDENGILDNDLIPPSVDAILAISRITPRERAISILRSTATVRPLFPISRRDTTKKSWEGNMSSVWKRRTSWFTCSGRTGE